MIHGNSTCALYLSLEKLQLDQRLYARNYQLVCPCLTGLAHIPPKEDDGRPPESQELCYSYGSALSAMPFHSTLRTQASRMLTLRSLIPSGSSKSRFLDSIRCSLLFRASIRYTLTPTTRLAMTAATIYSSR